MNKIRLKSVCLLNPPPNKKFENLWGTFLPMEKVNVGSFNLDQSLPYKDMSAGYTFMENNDVIRAIVTPCFENNKGTLLKDLKNGFAFGSTEFMCIRPKKINSKFLYYVTSSIDFNNYAITSMKGVGGLRRINSKFALTYQIDNINISQQTVIANFLDHQISKIDKEISLLEKKAELLYELKQSTIYEAVTKGINPDVKMKDSGIEWIGMIPEHWEVKRVKDLFRIKSGTTPDTLNKEFYEKEEVSWLNSGDFHNSFIYHTNKKISLEAQRLSNLKLFEINSIVIAMYGANVGEVGLLKIKSTVNQACAVLSHKNKLSNHFYYYYFISHRKKFIEQANGGGQSNINQQIIYNTYLPYPSLNEQLLIEEYLNIKNLKIDKFILLLKKKIELLSEYKKSLIYECVTGKTNDI